MEWTNNLATGVPEIDNQHKEIFNRVNKLSAACSEGKCGQVWSSDSIAAT